jgi:hypothetical protein
VQGGVSVTDDFTVSDGAPAAGEDTGGC